MNGQTWDVPTGKYQLVPHVWDGIGPPPPPGPDYDDTPYLDAVAYAEALMRADEMREEADRLRDRADDAEDEADEAVRKADTGWKSLGEMQPKLAAAIKDDPEAFSTVGKVRAYLAGPA